MRNFSKYSYGNNFELGEVSFFSVPIMYAISSLEKFSEILKKMKTATKTIDK